MLERTVTPRLRQLAGQFPAVTLTGPRQSGKTTLCRSVFSDRAYVNLELPDDRQHAVEDPRSLLSSMPEGGIIDEVQRAPELMSYIQADIDEHRDQRGRWILTGSQNLLLLESIGQSLAGRTALLHLLPLSYEEIVHAQPNLSLDEVLLFGGFPEIHAAQVPHRAWMEAYLATYVERDVRQVQHVVDLTDFERFLGLCAGRSSQLLNVSSLASAAGLRQETINGWLAILEASFVTHRIAPFFRNITKRLVKSPKIHFVDTGVLCHLLGIRDEEQLAQHPLRGEIFESWVISELWKAQINHGLEARLFFYRDRHATEIDAVLEAGQQVFLIEAKSGGTFRREMTRAMDRVAKYFPADILVDKVVVYGGDSSQARTGFRLQSWRDLAHGPWQGIRTE